MSVQIGIEDLQRRWVPG